MDDELWMWKGDFYIFKNEVSKNGFQENGFIEFFEENIRERCNNLVASSTCRGMKRGLSSG